MLLLKGEVSEAGRIPAGQRAGLDYPSNRDETVEMGVLPGYRRAEEPIRPGGLPNR